MPSGLKNAGATYMRDMKTIFHDMIHKEIEVYVDDVIIKSHESLDHLTYLKKFFDRLRRYNLKLNPSKCAFGVPADKLFGFIVSRRGIELDPSKIKVIQDLPPPKTKREVISFLGRLNYISRFIAKSTVVCEPIFKLLKKTLRQSGLNSVRLLLMLSITICPIHRYWFLLEKGVHCCCICLSRIVNSDACLVNMTRQERKKGPSIT